jgi:hypothetical protein
MGAANTLLEAPRPGDDEALSFPEAFLLRCSRSPKISTIIYNNHNNIRMYILRKSLLSTSISFFSLSLF